MLVMIPDYIKSFFMAGIFWNARGLEEPEKRRFLAETISEHKLEFVCIQETKKRAFADPWLAGVSGRFTFIWLWRPSVGASGGLLMGVREDLFEIDTCVASKYLTRMTLMNKRRVSNGIWSMSTELLTPETKKNS